MSKHGVSFDDVADEYDDATETAGVVGYLPDWVVLGAPLENGTYIVVASTSLNYAEIKAHIPKVRRAFEAAKDRDPRPVITLRAGLKEFVVGYGSTYAGALAAVLTRWEPDARRPGPFDGSRPTLVLLDDVEGSVTPSSEPPSLAATASEPESRPGASSSSSDA